MDTTHDAPIDRSDSLATKVYLRLRGALMRGRLAPGHRLVHRAIATELGVSPTPVREALLRLASEGALVLDERGIAHVPHLHPDRYAEILELRLELEGRAAERAALRAGPEAIAALDAIHAQLATAKAAGDIETMLSLNEDFHLRLADQAGMPVLRRLVEGLWMQCGPTLRLRYTVAGGADPAKHPHLALLAALRRQDPQGARAALTADLSENGRVLLDLLRAGGSAP
jgi:DNA-binding GntR family transcriptional regulator